ncbi:MAG: Inner membrane transport permease YbhR [candidate division WS2 bacterium ADurb.Bin280]|uniref:Inner membrane transport permease YbhR n=1 Tax=candidate division WS2 bacterium ADurb.Bin280 TaxID=1852829 RepID=A0A1V5SGK4_9BACT|nr:MAG: Inner membrane transport permease YbhR [candidate division WS2 bacterium ADurb.Bin280]
MFLKLFVADIKMMFRNKQALFWAFMFPVLFSFIFGFFFGKEAKSGTIAIVNNSKTQISESYVTALEDANIYTVKKDISLEEASEQIESGKIVAAVEIPESFGELPNLSERMVMMQGAPSDSNNIEIPKQTLKIFLDPANAQANAPLIGFTDKFLSQVNLTAQNASEIFTYEQEKTNNKDLTYYDFVLSGILGLSVMNSSITGIAIAMSKYREDKILKRITTTPVPTWAFILAEVLSRLILNVLQISVVLSIGIYFFDANIYGSIFALVMATMLGALLFQLIGFAIAALSKTTDAAQGMGTAITIPMMFLGGVFFPIDSLPKWLYAVVQYFPLSPLLKILRNISSEGASLFADSKSLYIVCAWAIGVLIFSIWRFRLSDE